MDRDCEISKSADVLEASLADDKCLFHVESGKYWTFTQTSARIWEILSQPCSVRTLSAALAEEFDTPLPTVERDVEAFVAFLLQNRLAHLEQGARDEAPPR